MPEVAKNFSRVLFLIAVFTSGTWRTTAQPVDSLRAVLEKVSGQKKVIVLLQLASAYGSVDWEESVGYAKQSLTLARESGNDSLLFESYYQLSKSLYGLGNYTDALTYGGEALGRAFDDRSKSAALHQLGMICQKRAEYQMALEHYLAALKIDLAAGNKKSASNTMNSISFVYRYMNQYNKAIEILKECLEISEEIDDKEGMARATFNIGFNLLENDRGEEAIPYFRKAVSGLTEGNEPNKFGAFYNNMSNCYRQMMPQNPVYYDSCLYYGKKNLVLKERLHDYRGIANAHNQLAAAYLQAGDFKNAVQYAGEALRLSDSLGFKQVRKNALLYLIIAGTQRRGLGQLNEYFNRYTEVTDSLNREIQSKTLNDLAAKYETKKKEAENRHLLQVNKQQARTNLYLTCGGFLLLVMVGLLVYFYNKQGKNKRTIEAQSRELQKLNDLKSEFFANISHELRTPLTLAQGNLELALDNGQLPEEKNGKLQNSKRNLKQLSRMIEDLLDLSKLEVGRYELKTTAVNLNQLLARLVAAFQSVSEDRKIILTWADKTSRTHYCSLDVRQFEKVINNLLYNAFKFTPSGGHIAVELSDRKDKLKINIKDNGVGIAESELPFIFQRFYQAGNQNDPGSHQGTGLGLAIAKKIVELHGGEIVVQSKPGEGTIFTVQLADTETLEEEMEEPIPVAEIVNVRLQKWRTDKPHILIVEDNTDMQNYLREILAKAFLVSTAGNGRIAWEWLQSNHPALVISDVMMPEMDGFEFLEKIKNNPATNALPFILLTAKTSADDRLKGLRLGVDDYITKPFDRDELIIKASNLIQNLHNRIEWQRDNAEDKLLATSKQAEDEQLVNRLRAYILENIKDGSLSVSRLAAEASLSQRQLQRKLTVLCGFTPGEFIMEVRLQHALQLLRGGSIVKVSQLAFEVGIATPHYLARQFFERFGKRPSDYL